MAKILLVEDDKSLREIYGVRLMAEGYTITSAGDGEEALAVAIKERPDLIVSDVMMPKISGFDMLDILRSTTETKNIKVIMMTALSSEDQRARGEALGADRYLVKSQVGIEDVVRTVHDVLGDNIQSAAPAEPVFPPAAAPIAAPAAPAPDLAPQPTMAVAPEPVAPQAAIEQPVVMPTEMPQPMAAPMPTPTAPPIAQPAPVAPVAPAAPIEPEPLYAPAQSVPVPPAPVYAPDPVAPAAPVIPEPVYAPEPVTTPVAPVAPIAVAPPVFPPAPTAPIAPAAAPSPYAAPAPFAQPTTLPEPTAPFSSNPPASLGDRIINPLPSADSIHSGVADVAAQMNQELNAHLQSFQQPEVAPQPQFATPPPPPIPPLPPQPGV